MQKKPVSFSRSASLTVSIFVALAVSFLVSLRADQQLMDEIELRAKSYALIDELQHTSDNLSALARAFVVTGDPRFQKYHQYVLDIRDGKRARPDGYHNAYWDLVAAKLSEPPKDVGPRVDLWALIREANFTAAEMAQLEIAKTNADRQTAVEKKAMQLGRQPTESQTPQQAKAAAGALLIDVAYFEVKASVVAPLVEFYRLLDQRTSAAITRAERFVWLLRTFMMLFGLSLMFRIYRVNHFLSLTLGGSITQVYGLITQMGQGDLEPRDLPPARPENSVMGWLQKTQAKLQEVERARQQAEAALRENESRYRTMVEGSAEPIMVHRDGALIYLNPSALKVLGGHSDQDFVGKSLYKLVHPHFHGLSRERSRLLLNSGQPLPAAELQFIRLDGRVIDVEAQSALVMLEGVPSIQVSWRDITERKKLEEQVRKLAFYDVLTGLPNRRLLDDRLHRAMLSNKRSNACGALMFLDLDNFKPLNDAHGHVVGDLLLIEVGERLRTCVREVDTVARFGGDEFVVLLGELSPDKGKAIDHAKNVALKIRTALSETYKLTCAKDQEVPVMVEHHCTVSLGVVVFTHDQASVGELLKQADSAMYRAKDAGRNAIFFVDGTVEAILR